MVVVLGGVGSWPAPSWARSASASSTSSSSRSGAVLAKIFVLVLIVLFIQKRPQGLFALKGRSAEA
jgi:urea transport system permease protein